MSIEELEDTGPSGSAGEAVPASAPAERDMRVNGSRFPRLMTRSEPEAVKGYVRRRLAEAMPEIARHLIEGAKEGNLEDLKALVQMSGIDAKTPAEKPRSRRTGRTLEQILLHDWRKEPLNGAGTKKFS